MAELKQTIRMDMKGVAKIKSDLKELERRTRSLEGAGKSSAGTNKTVGSSFKNLALAVGGSTVALMGLQKVFRSMITTGKEFEQSMANVRAISGASGAEFKALEDNAKRLGATTVHTASAVAGLQTEFAKLGFTAQEITQVTGATLALSTATGSDLAVSASVAGETLRAFGLDVSETTRVTDVMAESFSSSALDMQKFSDSMTYVAPIAKMAGFSIEGTTAMLGRLANAGISGSMAGTALRRIFLELSNESSKLSKRLGGSITSVDELVPALQKLNSEGISTAEMKDLVGQRAISAFEVLIQGADSVNNLTESFNNAGGSAQRMADIQLDTLQGKTDLLKSAFDGLMITMFELSEETLKSATESMTKFIDSIDEEDIKAYTESLKLVTIGLGLYSGAMLIAKIRTDGFSLSLTKSGIGAIAVGVGILTAELLKYADVFKTVIPEEEKHNQELERQAKAIADIQKANEGLKLSELQSQYDDLNMALNGLGIQYRDSNLALKEANDNLKFKIHQSEESFELAELEVEKQKEINQGIQERIDKYGLEISAIDNLINKIKEKQETQGVSDEGDGDNAVLKSMGFTDEAMDEAQKSINDFYMKTNEDRLNKIELEEAQTIAHLEAISGFEGASEKEILKVRDFYAKKKAKLNDDEVFMDSRKYSQLSGSIANFIGRFAGGQKVEARLKQTQATIDAIASSNKAWNIHGGFPGGIIPAGISLARGMANVMAISQQIGEFRTAQIGMDEIVTQPTTILAGEAGTSERVQVTPLNEDEPTGGGSSPINISFSGNVMSQDFIEEEAIPMIKEALRRGSDMSIA